MQHEEKTHGDLAEVQKHPALTLCWINSPTISSCGMAKQLNEDIPINIPGSTLKFVLF